MSRHEQAAQRMEVLHGLQRVSRERWQDRLDQELQNHQAVMTHPQPSFLLIPPQQGRAGRAGPGQAGREVTVGREGRVGRVGWQAGSEWRAGPGGQGGARNGGLVQAGWRWWGGWLGGQGGAGWGRVEEHRVWAGTGASGRSCCERTYKWLRGCVCAVAVVTWEKVSDNFRHFATILEVCYNFSLIAMILD